MIANVALAATVAASLAGCAKVDSPEVATAGEHADPSAESVSVDADTEYVESVRAYVACLRQVGIDVTDPDSAGHFDFAGDLLELKQDPAFIAAGNTCAPLLLLPPAPTGRDGFPVLTDEQIEARRAFAKCMREHGATNFPDPDPDGYNDRPQPGEDYYAGADDDAFLVCGPIIGETARPGSGQG